MKLAMIPARMGSQRLKRKNLREIDGVPLIAHAIRRCQEADIFTEIWVNSEHLAFGEIAEKEGARFHRRPDELANNQATSEQYVYEFLTKHSCDYLFQVHSIAPLMTPGEIRGFVEAMLKEGVDVMLSAVYEQIECAYRNQPVNFTFDEKTNSQDLDPVQRITWAMTGWRPPAYREAFEAGKCATYAGTVGFFPVNRMAGHVIKTEDDLRIAEAFWALLRTPVQPAD